MWHLGSRSHSVSIAVLDLGYHILYWKCFHAPRKVPSFKEITGKDQFGKIIGFWHYSKGLKKQVPIVIISQGSLTCCSPWGHKESDMTEQLNNNNLPNHMIKEKSFFSFSSREKPRMLSKLSMKEQRVDLGSWPRCVQAPKLMFFPHIYVVSLESQCDGFVTLLIPRSYWTSTESSNTDSMLKQLSQRTLGDIWKLWSCGSLVIVSELLTYQV